MTLESSITNRSFILFGALRSGTTLLRLMLNGHPQITCPGEMDFLIDHLDNSGKFDEAALQADRIYRAHEDLFPTQSLTNPTPHEIVARVARVAGQGQGDGIAALILHRNLNRALQVYPSMRVVNLMRDPRDVARSSIGMGWAGNSYYGVDHWIGTQRDWQNSQPQLGADQQLTVHYEALIAKPQETLSQIAEFVGLKFHAGMLAYDEGSTYSKPDPNLIEQWKRKQTAREVGLVEGKIGPMLEQAGYSPSGHSVVHPGAIERARLWAKNKRGQWTFRFKRYGYADPIFAKATERLGVPKLGLAARKRMDTAQIRHLK
jgi:hypothetical protein